MPNVAQSSATLAGIKLVMVGLPTAGLLLAGLAMLFYPMRKGGHDAIVEQLAARRLAEPETLNPELAG